MSERVKPANELIDEYWEREARFAAQALETATRQLRLQKRAARNPDQLRISNDQLYERDVVRL